MNILLTGASGLIGRAINSELTKKGNTVPKGKKPVAGIQAAINMRKKFK